MKPSITTIKVKSIPNNFIMIPVLSPSHCLSLILRQILICFLSLQSLNFPEFMQMEPYSRHSITWASSFRTIIWNYIHVFACSNSLLLFIEGYYSILWIYHNLLIHSLNDGHLGSFNFWWLQIKLLWNFEFLSFVNLCLCFF